MPDKAYRAFNIHINALKEIVGNLQQGIKQFIHIRLIIEVTR